MTHPLLHLVGPKVLVLRTLETGRRLTRRLRKLQRKLLRRVTRSVRRAAARWSKRHRDLVTRASRLVSGMRQQLSRVSGRVATTLDRLVRYSVPGERTTCPACGSGRVNPVATMGLKGNVRGRRVGFATLCNTCGLLFASPMPEDEEVEALYARDGEYAHSLYDEDAPRRLGDVSHRELLLLFEGVQEQLNVLAPGPGTRALDFGCGDGRFLDALAAVGWETFGVEPATRIAFDRHGELEDTPDVPTFRLVVVNHVLEHVSNPLQILRRLSASLESGGVLYVSVPNLEALDRHRDMKYCIRSRVHIVAYTSDCLRALFRLVGVKLVAVLDDPELDDLRTGGVPRRLRVLGIKDGVAASSGGGDPAQAARRALRRYWLGSGWTTFLWKLLPVRVQARFESAARHGRLRRRKALHPE